MTDKAVSNQKHTAPARKLAVGAAILGGFGWLSVFGLKLTSVPEGWWRWRDDAVITLSHARNALEEGSIGVSPGGDRTEGYSSPLQFTLSFIFFALVRADYKIYLDFFVTFSIFAIGALLTLLLIQGAQNKVVSPIKLLWVGVLGSSVVAVLVTGSWSATGWLVSGMENPLIIISGLAILNLISLKGSSPPYFALIGVSVFLLGVSRVELPAFTAPLLLSVLLFSWSQVDSNRKRSISIGLSVFLPITLWGLVHLIRLLYFGQVLPNTAIVQQKIPGLSQLAILIVLTLIAVFFLGVIHLNRPVGKKSLLFLSAGFLVVAAFFTGQIIDGGGRLVATVDIPMLAGAIGVVTALLAANYRFLSSRNNLDAVLFSLTFIPVAQFLVAGPARLDTYRVAGLALIFSLIWLGSLATKIALDLQAVREEGPRELTRFLVVSVPLILTGAIAMLVSGAQDEPRGLCCGITPSEERILEVAKSVGGKLSEAALPIVSNPDLGKISFAKEAILVDLGFLGDPLFSRVFGEKQASATKFMSQVARPDVVQTHQSWSCLYTDWLTSDDFIASYEIREQLVQEPYGDDCVFDGQYTIWVRTDATKEYALSREIVQSPNPIAVISQAVETCVQGPGDPFKCQWVRRSVTRASPQLHQLGLLEDAAHQFEAAPSARLDREIIMRGPGWADRAYHAFTDLAEGR